MQLVPQEIVLNCAREQIVDVPVPQFKEDGLPVVPHEPVQNRVGEQIVDVPVRHIKEDGLLLVPQQRVHNRAAYTGESVHCEVVSSS